MKTIKINYETLPKDRGLTAKESLDQSLRVFKDLKKWCNVRFEIYLPDQNISNPDIRFKWVDNIDAAGYYTGNKRILIRSDWHGRDILLNRLDRVIPVRMLHEILHRYNYKANPAADRFHHSTKRSEIYNTNLVSRWPSAREYEFLFRIFGKNEKFWPSQLTEQGDYIRMYKSEIQSLKDERQVAVEDRTRNIELSKDNSFNMFTRREYQRIAQEHHNTVINLNRQISEVHKDLRKVSQRWIKYHQELKGIL